MAVCPVHTRFVFRQWKPYMVHAPLALRQCHCSHVLIESLLRPDSIRSSLRFFFFLTCSKFTPVSQDHKDLIKSLSVSPAFLLYRTSLYCVGPVLHWCSGRELGLVWLGFYCQSQNYFVVCKINPFPHNDTFWRPWETSLLKILWEKEKLLVTSNFSFSHSVFYPLR